MRSLTVQEMLIEVELQMQRLASKKRDGIAEEAILWRLNTAQNRFVKYRIKPDPNMPAKYVVDEKYNTDIQALQTPDFRIISFKDTDKRSYGYLPYDFAYLLNVRVRIVPDCNSNFATALLDPAPCTIIALKYEDSPNTVAPYYAQFVVSVDTNDITLNTTGTASKKQKYEFIEAIQARFKDLGVQCYWERFDTVYLPGHFLVLRTYPFTGAGVDVPAVNYNLSIDGVSPTPFSALPKGKNDGVFRRYKTYEALQNEVPCRVVKDDFLHDSLNNNYYDRTDQDSPICQLMDNKIIIHTSERFLVSEIIIDYIRKPKPISLSLNQSSELDGSTHEEICSLATEILLGNVEAGNYTAKVQENLNRLE